LDLGCITAVGLPIRHISALVHRWDWPLNIRAKVIVLLSAVFLAFALVEWTVSEMLLLPRFEQIERDNATTATKRIDAGVTQSLDGLQVSATDWGNWADTYRFMLDHNKSFSQENLNPIAMKQLHLTVLAFIDLEGKYVWSYSMDPITSEPLSLDLFAGGSLPRDFPWIENLRRGEPGHALIATNHGVLLAAVAPILDGYGHGPVRGAVIMGRMLTAREIAQIGVKAQTKVTIAALHTVGQTVPSFLPNTAPPGERTQILDQPDTTQVFHVYNDIYGQPILTLRVDVPRTITANARTTVNAAMGFTIGAAVAVLLLTLFALNSTVFAPLALVTRHATKIGAGDDLSTRLNLARRDEIGTLAQEFDRMVGKVAESRRQSIDNSYQAGMAEFSRGVLHNIGNAITPLSVRIAKLKEQLRAAPTADVERALAECGRSDVTPERQADLDEFLRLACAEFASVIQAAQADVDMMVRQAGMVQTALAERLPSAHVRTVIESVDLPAIIHQSLEIVPDQCRDLVDIELDRSLQSVGPVWTARTVLRLVIQNLVINAAEAVRAANSGRGTVRFTAAIQRDNGQDKLLLECQDTGCGIEPQNVGRVFERGFSTKSSKGNSGIGLHWCATAINALGGRMWASSQGSGQGATLHLIVPIAAPAEAADTKAA
jgi:sensor domain CHASE-containing protein